jgi:hypothetical protein
VSDEPSVFLQWKGTDACLDFYCACGRQWHFDGYFAKELTCGHCGQTWELPHTLTPQPVEPEHPLTLVFDEAVLPAPTGVPLGDEEFTLFWPRPEVDGARPGSIVTVVDDDNGHGRAMYADLIKGELADGGLTLTLRTRGPV